MIARAGLYTVGLGTLATVGGWTGFACLPVGLLGLWLAHRRARPWADLVLWLSTLGALVMSGSDGLGFVGMAGAGAAVAASVLPPAGSPPPSIFAAIPWSVAAVTLSLVLVPAGRAAHASMVALDGSTAAGLLVKAWGVVALTVLALALVHALHWLISRSLAPKAMHEPNPSDQNDPGSLVPTAMWQDSQR